MADETPRRDPQWLRRWWPMFTVLAALLLVVGFGGPEGVALIDPGVGGTYSEWWRDVLGTQNGDVTPGWVILTVILLGFAVWFPGHLLRWWPWERPRRDE